MVEKWNKSAYKRTLGEFTVVKSIPDHLQFQMLQPKLEVRERMG